MLELINKTGDIKKIPENRLNDLAEEIRRFMIEKVTKTGGHLASSLGTVELTIALHRVYDLPDDKIIWDVGHQAYTHKILTGRKDEFDHLRQEGGISGFPRRAESASDSFDTGHSSTSISAGLGYVKARELNEEDYSVVSVIGDGALTGGLAYEALNNVSIVNSNFVIVLNDNEMSISKNVGGISDYLARVRTSEAYTGLKMAVSSKLEKLPKVGSEMIKGIRKTKSSIKHFVVPGMFFEDMGLTYLGPVDGHDIKKLENVLKEARSFPGPVLVHVITEKGRGYAPASKNPTKFHGISAFKVNDAESALNKEDTFTSYFAREMTRLGRENKKIAAITAAMKEGVGLKRFASLYPERFFDVGIAEEHAVTFASGLALGGFIPVVAIYSSFLQRAMDQIMMDVCAQNLHVIFAVDRSGFVGEDGKTHQGLFDISYLSEMPNMKLMAPKDGNELVEMLDLAVKMEGPVAIRYPKGAQTDRFRGSCAPVRPGKAEVLRRGKDLCIWAVGNMCETGDEVCCNLEKAGYSATLINTRFVKPFDKELLKEISADHRFIMTLEENISIGGFGRAVLNEIAREKLDLITEVCAVSDSFIDHGTAGQQRKRCGLDAASLTERALKLLHTQIPEK